MCFRSGLCSFSSGSVRRASRCASSADGERAAVGKADKAPFEGCSRGGPRAALPSPSTSDCCVAQEHLRGTARKQSCLPAIDFTALRDLRVVAVVSVFPRGTRRCNHV